MTFWTIIEGGLLTTVLLGSYVGALVGSSLLSYHLFMGKDPWDGRFRGAGACYFAGAFVLAGVAFTVLTALWSLTGIFGK